MRLTTENKVEHASQTARELKVGVYPGSFDPLTNGHLDIIRRASTLFDRLIVAVLVNDSKKNPLFTMEERVNLIKKCTKDMPNIEVGSFD